MEKLEVHVSSEWLKDNMKSLYEGILAVNKDLHKGFEAYITVSESKKISTHIDEDTEPLFFDELDAYPETEVQALFAKIGAETI